MLIPDAHSNTHKVDRCKRDAEREVHTLPHSRLTACPGDIDGRVFRTAEGLGGANRSIHPGEKTCGLSITEASC